MPAQIDRVSGGNLGFPAGAVFDAALDAVVVMDGEGIIRDWNRAAEEMFGYSRDESVGRELAELIIPGPLRDAHRNALRRYVETGERVILDRRIELSAMRRSGDEFPVELTVTRFPVDGPVLFAGFLRALDARDEARRQNARLQQRMTFLAQAGLVLDSSLETDETLRRLADLTVPELADMTVIDLLDARTVVRAAVAAAVEPQTARRLERTRGIEPLSLASEHPVARVLSTGAPVLLESISTADQTMIAQGPEHLQLIRELHYRSAIVVPLIARQHVLGALSLLRTSNPEPYGRDHLVLAEELARRAALAIDNSRLYSSMSHLALTLQQSLLPQRIPDIPGIGITYRYLAATQGQMVGGDFYDVFQISGGRWGIAIGDVCGKGPQAAALTSLARYTIRALAREDPGDALGQLNNAVLGEVQSSGRFLTAFVGICEWRRGAFRITYASAGHPPALVDRAGETAELIQPTGPILGIVETASFQTGELMLAHGDVLILYTDGLTDAQAPRQVLTEQDLAARIKLGGEPRGEALADLLLHAATDGSVPRDDIAVLLVEPRRTPR